MMLGSIFLTCVSEKQIETGVVEEVVEEDPIHWDEIECSYNIRMLIGNMGDDFITFFSKKEIFLLLLYHRKKVCLTMHFQ